MTELTLMDAARAIRPFLPELAGPAAADLDQRLAALLAAADAGQDVEDQLAALLSEPSLAGWATDFLEHDEVPHSLADRRRLRVQGIQSFRLDRKFGAPFPAATSPPPPPSSQPPSPSPSPPPTKSETLAYPRLDAPAQVAPGEVFTLTAGLRADVDTALSSMGPMDLPADVDLEVAVQFDPLAFVLTSPSTTATLRRTADDPWPSAEFRFVALAGQELLAARSIGVKFLRGGQIVGFASRALVVRAANDAPASPAAHPGVTDAQDPPADGLDLRWFADDDIDLLLVIQRAADVAGTRLVFTAHSRHADIADQASPVTEVLKAEGGGGNTPQQIGQEARLKVSTTNDELDLFTWLAGQGISTFTSLPAPIGAAVRAAVARGTTDDPARILLLSEEPYVPWELAVDPLGWPSALATTSPFLGAHAAISRWVLGPVPPPAPRPLPAIDVKEKALVSAHYDGVVSVMKWPALPEAEAEVTKLEAFLAPDVTVIPPDLHAVLNLLGGTPPADLMHFALHGNFDPLGIQGGLILLRTDGGTVTAQNLQENHVKGKRLSQQPFVYLNACQVATGNSAAFGGYGGLAAAFLTAGARGVLAPLWNIKDGTASSLASEFYQLSAGADRLPAAEILRRFRARYTEDAVQRGEPDVNATLIAFQLFGHPGFRLFAEPAARTPELSHG
jgi:hypothetical protein